VSRRGFKYLWTFKNTWALHGIELKQERVKPVLANELNTT
jgi:hypothetical protein